MEFLGIGPLELFFIILIALIVLGPKDMVKAGRTLGRFMRQIVTSESWHTIQQASRELRYLPNKLMREAGIEDLQKDFPKVPDIRKEIGLDEMKKEVQGLQEDIADWTTPPTTIQTPEEPLGAPASDPPPEHISSEPTDLTPQPSDPPQQN
jgi:Sec-independent protein translocase protein TatA